MLQTQPGFLRHISDFKCKERKGDDVVAVLTGANGFSLVIMKNKEGDPVYPNAFHIGFMLDSEDEVTKTYEQLRTAGIVSGQEPKK